MASISYVPTTKTAVFADGLLRWFAEFAGTAYNSRRRTTGTAGLSSPSSRRRLQPRKKGTASFSSAWGSVMNKPLVELVLPRLAKTLYRELQRFRAGKLNESQFATC